MYAVVVTSIKRAHEVLFWQWEEGEPLGCNYDRPWVDVVWHHNGVRALRVCGVKGDTAPVRLVDFSKTFMACMDISVCQHRYVQVQVGEDRVRLRYMVIEVNDANCGKYRWRGAFGEACAMLTAGMVVNANRRLFTMREQRCLSSRRRA